MNLPSVGGLEADEGVMRKVGGKQIIAILLGAVAIGVLVGALAARWPHISILR